MKKSGDLSRHRDREATHTRTYPTRDKALTTARNHAGQALPIVPAALQSKLFEMNAHYRDDSVSKVDKGAAVALCAKLQARMREEAATTAALQVRACV